MREFWIGIGVMSIVSAIVLYVIDRYIRSIEKGFRTT